MPNEITRASLPPYPPPPYDATPNHVTTQAPPPPYDATPDHITTQAKPSKHIPATQAGGRLDRKLRTQCETLPPPGYADPLGHMQSLMNVFKAHTLDDLVSALTTAATRVDSPLHSVAQLAIDKGHVLKSTVVGLSTVGEELRNFRFPLRIGF